MQSGIDILTNNIKISFTSGKEKILHIIFFSVFAIILKFHQIRIDYGFTVLLMVLLFYFY